jgi:hypothetical protein
MRVRYNSVLTTWAAPFQFAMEIVMGLYRRCDS